MNKKNHQHTCAICGQTFPERDLVPGGAVRDVVQKEILRDKPDWTPESFLCRPDLMKYRAMYVHSLLESEKGEVSALEQEVLHSIRDHELLAKNVDAEFEQKWSLGERLADRIATFGGSWAFLMCFGAFIALWIGMELDRTDSAPSGPVSLHPLEPRSVLSGCNPGAGDHDEPEPPRG